MEIKETLTRTIKALSLRKIDDGQIGFLTTDPEESKLWYNVYGESDVLTDLSKTVVSKGNTIEFEYNNGVVGSLKLIEKAKGENPDMIKISGKDYMLYTGLLKKAHEKTGKFSMEIIESWVNNDMTMAWCKVRVTAWENEQSVQVFDGFGSSTPKNASAIGSSHPVEMAHTRAKGRALRDYLNIGEVMAEELSK